MKNKRLSFRLLIGLSLTALCVWCIATAVAWKVVKKETKDAVSYTHLDVYKRQKIHRQIYCSFRLGKSMKVLEGAVAAPNAKIAVVIARFNSFINESLLEGAVDALKRIGQVKDENITIVRAPGAYELPLVARRLAESKKLDVYKRQAAICSILPMTSLANGY